MIHEQSANFERLVQMSQCLIWSVDANGNYVFLSDAARDIYGPEPGQFVGQPFTGLATPGAVARDEKMIEKVLQGEECLNHETVHVRADGEAVHLIVSARPVGSRRRTGAVGTALDVTELHSIRERQARDERIRALGSLAGGIAHDFKNLLTVMAGQAELASVDSETTDTTKRRLKTIMDTSERGRRLAEQLLGFATNKRTPRTEVDLVALVEQMRDLIERLTPPAIRVETRMPTQALPIEADWSQLEQVIVNLLLNARDAMPGGGRLGIRLARREIDERMWALLEVEDDGAGMDKAVLGRVFEPFFTTKPPGEGSGLGLATVYNIVRRHGGSVSAESRPGKGSRFKILLPLATSPVPVPA